MTNLSEDEFDKRFTLVTFPDGSQTTDDRRVMLQYPENRVWSLVDDGDGGLGLLSGFAAVNFIAWQVTEEEHPGQYEISVTLDAFDETIDPETGEFYPRGRCDSCGAPCDDTTGDCTADASHDTAISGEEES